MIAWLAQRSDQQGGWSWQKDPGTDGLDGFLLLSRYDGDQSRHVIELVSLKTGEVVHSWRPDPEALLSNVTRKAEFEGTAQYELWNNAYFRFIHPYLNANGELLLKDHQSPLFLISACGDLKWFEDIHLFHHSTEPDGEGGYWIPSYILEDQENLSREFTNDALARVSADGEVVFLQSMIDIFDNNGLRHLMFPAAHFYKDPIHLNDIEPAMFDGPYWRKGDLFLSFRSPSLVALYRPSTGQIVWSKSGPWQSQHDVDILDESRIAIFNNNAYDSGLGARIDGVSETVVYDFATDTVSFPYRDVMETVNSGTISEGLQDFTPSGHLVFEEENRGRLFVIDASGDIVALFLNKAQNGYTYRMGWSRYMTQSHGEAALKAITDSGCLTPEG
nr:MULTISPECIES: arylsulfotransferase family protein [unclassified Ruegeria]